MSDRSFDPHLLTANVKLLHKIALVYSGQVLILKRSEQAASRSGKWDLPGGNSDWPTDTTSAQLNLHQRDISREIQEEAGIIIPPTVFSQDKLVFFATYFEPEQQLYSINCGWVVGLSTITSNAPSFPEVTLSQEHTEFRWIVLAELESFDFGGADREYETTIIRRALSKRE